MLYENDVLEITKITKNVFNFKYKKCVIKIRIPKIFCIITTNKTF